MVQPVVRRRDCGSLKQEQPGNDSCRVTTRTRFETVRERADNC